MSLTDVAGPLPATAYGKADWQDYINNWREKDAEWLMQRSVQRFQTSALRPPTGEVGQVIYNGQTDRLEMWSGTKGTWITSLMFQNLTSTTDTSTSVNVSHSAAAGKGITFAPALVSIDIPVNLTNGVLTTTANNVAIQTPAQKKATLTTTATDLVSDTQITAPGLKLTAGTLDAAGRAVNTGALTATSVSAGSIAVTGLGAITGVGTLTAATVNATTLNASTTSTINGVVFNANWLNASVGLVTGGGYFRGDGSGPSGAGAAVMGFRDPSSGAPSGPTLTVDSQYAHLRGAQGMLWHNAAGSGVAWISPVVVSGGALNATDWPDGTIWFQ